MIRTTPQADPRHASEKALAGLAALACIPLVGYLDWATHPQISLGLLYLFPIALAAWKAGHRTALALSIAASGVWLTTDVVSTTGRLHPGILAGNAVLRAAVFVLIVFLLERLRVLTDHLETLVTQRTVELTEEVARRKLLEREAVDLHHREQERVAHELHDGLGAVLAGAAFRLKAVVEVLVHQHHTEAEGAREVLTAIHTASGQVRNFARLLSPLVGEVMDLGPAVAGLVGEMQRVFGLPCSLQVAGPLPLLSPHKAQHVYRIVQEAVRNAIQHAEATRVDVSLACDATQLELEVRNDGQPWQPAGPTAAGLGLRIMRYRTDSLGGTLLIRAPESGGGTILTCRVPISGPPGAESTPKKDEGPQ